MEVFKDPKTIAFFLWPALGCLIGGTGVQYNLILRAFGFSVLQSTILVIPGGASQILGILVGTFALRRFPVRRAWSGRFIFSVLTVYPRTRGKRFLLSVSSLCSSVAPCC